MATRRKPAKAMDQLDDVENKSPTDEIEVVIDDENAENDEIEASDDESEIENSGGGDEETEPLAVLRAAHDAHKAELEAEKRARADAESRARDAENRAQQHEATARTATDVALENALLVTKQNIENAAAAIADAARRGDWESYGKAQAQLAENNAYLTDLNNKKTNFEAQAKTQAPRNEGVEAYISSRAPETQRWLREHYDDVFLNERKGMMAQAAHQLAVAKGIVPDTADYFEFIDSQMGYTKVEPEKKAAPPGAKKGVPAAPASRTSFGSPAGGGKTQVRLSMKQREYAESLRPDLPAQEAWKIYAAGVAEINSGNSHLQWSKDRYK
jgi:hypothetical protein